MAQDMLYIFYVAVPPVESTPPTVVIPVLSIWRHINTRTTRNEMKHTPCSNRWQILGNTTGIDSQSMLGGESQLTIHQGRSSVKCSPA